MARMILVTSFKGGVGKTTFSANLAACFAKNGKRVLVCDCDLESRCLDLVLGAETQPLFNICDAVSETCDVKDAIMQSEKCETLFFMPAPAFYPEALQNKTTDDIFTPEAVKAFLEKLKEEYDVIVFDLPARPDGLYKSLVPCVDTVLVVSAHTAVSLRAAEKTAVAVSELCAGAGQGRVPEILLVVNSFRAARVAHGERAGLLEILEKAKLPLAGVLPFDEEMAHAQEKGALGFETPKGCSPFWQAVENTAKRLCGKQVGLLAGVRVGVAKKKLY